MSESKNSTAEIKTENNNLNSFTHLPQWPPVNISFEDINFLVENGIDGNLPILRSLSGKFSSGQLIAIMGPSGSGKTTLLNILAGYRVENITGNILINNNNRNLKTFRRMSRYIMQEDIRQKGLTVRDVMTYAADLKLGFKDLSKKQKMDIVHELIRLLHLEKSLDTDCSLLSGGEMKRLSICQELVNNPPVLFLDEPTTGLDDYNSFLCIEMLKKLAQGRRTVICSIHTPSAKVFDLFDHIYVMTSGQCAYQGSPKHIIPFMEMVGLSCPKTFNPADFIIEAACGDYGREPVKRMIELSENGLIEKWSPCCQETIAVYGKQHEEVNEHTKFIKTQFDVELNTDQLNFKCSGWEQFIVLIRRSTKQIVNDKDHLYLRFFMHIFLGLIIGGMYWQIGNDGSRAIYNFGFCFTIVIAFLYIPMMPNLLEFPIHVQNVKREHFNRWYRCMPYYLSFILSKFPVQLINSLIYLTMVYFISGQPIESFRIFFFFIVSILTSLTSESFGIMIASRLSVTNGSFMGPVAAAPMILFSVYNMGSGQQVYTPFIFRICMRLDYLRYALEGILKSIYGYDRKGIYCPEDQDYCHFQKPDFLLKTMGFEDTDMLRSISMLLVFYITFNIVAFALIKNRLSVNRSNLWLIRVVSSYIKKYLNLVPN